MPLCQLLWKHIAQLCIYEKKKEKGEEKKEKEKREKKPQAYLICKQRIVEVTGFVQVSNVFDPLRHYAYFAKT